MNVGLLYALLGAGLAIILCGIGSSIGIGCVGREANGVLSEEPEKFGTMLLLVALPGTQGIYGFLTGFLVIMKIGILGGKISAISPSVMSTLAVPLVSTKTPIGSATPMA